jgi:hypothetical protein
MVSRRAMDRWSYQFGQVRFNFQCSCATSIDFEVVKTQESTNLPNENESTLINSYRVDSLDRTFNPRLSTV